jgi:hypothetical protein
VGGVGVGVGREGERILRLVARAGRWMKGARFMIWHVWEYLGDMAI